MYQHDAPGFIGDVALYEVLVDLQCLWVGFYEDRNQPHTRDGKNGGDIGVGRYQDLIPLVELTNSHFSHQDQLESIQSVTAGNAVFGTDESGIILLKLLHASSL